jgi:hypothetical protein
MEEGSEKMTKAAERGRIFAEEVGREQQQWRTGGWFCFGKGEAGSRIFSGMARA